MNSSQSYGSPSNTTLNFSNGCEPPACVQNAMITKDKKPFTYTPGGIDLSQIKSPRMAKRIARNAQYEGVTGPTKLSPLAQPNTSHQKAQQSAQALGMPVQVFPNGPPPPPLPTSSGNIPPPPPPINRNNLAPQTNDIIERKTPSPQIFEPPPLGCRPEIKIPSNPIASLKKVPKPKEKNDFWIEEYKKERSASPMITNEINTEQNSSNQKPESISNDSEPTKSNLSYNMPSVQEQQPLQPLKCIQDNQSFTGKQYSPTKIYQQKQSPPNKIDSYDSLQQPGSPVKLIQEQHQSQSPTNFQLQSQFQTKNSSSEQQQQQQQQQQPKNSQVGSLYIPPVPQENLITNRQQHSQQKPLTPPLQQHLQNQQQQRSIQANNPPTPRWMAQKPSMKEVPEWIRDESISTPQPQSPIQHVQSPEVPLTLYNNISLPESTRQNIKISQPFINNDNNVPSLSPIPATTTGLRVQITPKNTNNYNSRERIIPIQIEQTPTRTPSTPGFGPQPFYNVNQQFNSITPQSENSPGYYARQSPTVRNPNQFVDQGYNNMPSNWSTQQRIQHQSSSPSPTISGGTRIIPIAFEGQESPLNINYTRGPINSSPLIIQNDPRSLQHQNSWGGNSQPNQSKSFRILQKLTDTEDDKQTSTNNGNDKLLSGQSTFASTLQRPQYSRQMTNNGNTANSDVPLDQMRKMQLNQAPLQQRLQFPRYIQHNYKPDNLEHDQPHHYIHPSEQQVPEPKKYTGSAIPSRSFKILQAMTQPENAGPGQSDL